MRAAAPGAALATSAAAGWVARTTAPMGPCLGHRIGTRFTAYHLAGIKYKASLQKTNMTIVTMRHSVSVTANRRYPKAGVKQ
jgi:hypothetical protein